MDRGHLALERAVLEIARKMEAKAEERHCRFLPSFAASLRDACRYIGAGAAIEAVDLTAKGGPDA